MQDVKNTGGRDPVIDDFSRCSHPKQSTWLAKKDIRRLDNAEILGGVSIVHCLESAEDLHGSRLQRPVVQAQAFGQECFSAGEFRSSEIRAGQIGPCEEGPFQVY